LDANGLEMSNLYRFLKRNSSYFHKTLGKARRIKEHNNKFLCNRYGEVKYHYGPHTDYAVIENDIKKLLFEKFKEETYKELLDPKDKFL
jgi:glutathione peroxidase-family protein